MKLLKLLLISLTFLSVTYRNTAGQTESSSIYENIFFALDFENQQINISDVERYFFTTFPHNDPTLGDVVYDRLRWKNEEIIKLDPNGGLYGYIKNRNDSSSFDSFRFTSKPYFNLTNDVKKILFVFKGKLPSGKGLWPAWWLNGSREDEWIYKSFQKYISDDDLDLYSGKGEFYSTPSPVNCTDWPAGGEVDIIETINGDNIVYNTIHTCPQMCDSEWNDDGVLINCANATSSDPNSGCSGVPYQLTSPEGTFACLWEENQINFYYWEPGSDVRSEEGPLSNNPNPEKWNKHLKNHVRFLKTDFKCDEGIHMGWQCTNCEGKDKCSFVNLKMVINTTVCGKWAGSNFDETKNSASNCKTYIVNEGLDSINNQYLKIEYVSVKKID